MDDVSKAVAWLAAKDPVRPAVVDEVTVLTYGALHERADRWAIALQTAGFAPGHEIMLLLPNRAEFVVLLIAAIRAEVVPIVLHAEFASKDVAALASRTSAEALITSREIAVEMRLDLRTDLQVLCIEDFDLSISPNSRVSPSCIETDIVFFSSGTTGKPKGAVVPRWVFNLVTPFTALGRKPLMHLLCRPLFFRAHMTLLCNILQEGNTVVMARRGDPSIWMSLIERYQVYFVSLGPSDIIRWLDVLESRGDAFPVSVKHIMSTGAPLSNSLKWRIKELLPLVRVTDLYGTSEVGAITMIDNDEWESKDGSCGKPLFFSTVRILDEYKREASVLEVGEICVQSRYRMKEYYKDRDTTTQTCEGDYVRTGDLGYLDEQGYLYLVGRMNRVINCNGIQIFPEEVENVLREWHNTKETVVIGRKHPQRIEQPLAFVRLCEQARKDDEAMEEMAHALLTHCKSRLASYKVPVAILFINDIPLNTAGKIDFRELEKRVAEQHEYTFG